MQVVKLDASQFYKAASVERGIERCSSGPFVSSRIQSYKAFASYLVGQLLMYDRLVGGDAEHMQLHCCALVHECFRLGWPQHYISNALRAMPSRHQPQLVRELRFVGRALKKNEYSTVIDMPSFSLQTHSSLHERVICVMASAEAQASRSINTTPWLPFTRALLQFLQQS